MATCGQMDAMRAYHVIINDGSGQQYGLTLCAPDVAQASTMLAWWLDSHSRYVIEFGPVPVTTLAVIGPRATLGRVEVAQ